MHIQSPSPAAFGTIEAETETARRMVEAATALVASLSVEQRSVVAFPVDSEIRMKWDYRPGPRIGIPLKQLDSSQRQLVFALLATGLSCHAYVKALSIMSLEKVLGELESNEGGHFRDPDLYYVALFGTLSGKAPWGWRLEGHHVSVNFLIVDGKRIAPTPNFLGANPAHVLQGSMTGWKILAAEEELARRFLSLLDAAQKGRALIDVEAPADIVTRWDPRVKLDSPLGLPVSGMIENQKKAIEELMLQYVSRMPQDVVDRQLNQIEKKGKKFIHFAWAGSEQTGKPHYYRLHGPSFLVEYDNTQNNANHIHTVWRSIRNDWGEDLLRGHYSRSH